MAVTLRIFFGQFEKDDLDKTVLFIHGLSLHAVNGYHILKETTDWTDRIALWYLDKYTFKQIVTLLTAYARFKRMDSQQEVMYKDETM